MLDGMTLLLEYFWQIFVFQMYFFQIKIFYFLLFYITVIFIHFFVFALDSLKITSVLNSRLPGPRWRAPHICTRVQYWNFLRFIRLLLANQIACIFRSKARPILFIVLRGRSTLPISNSHFLYFCWKIS